MLALKKLAVTGSLASGKSTVCLFFQEYGAYTISADAIVHQLLSFDPLVIQQVGYLFGSVVFHEGKLERRKIAEQLALLPDKWRELEQILHPQVFTEIQRHYRLVSTQTTYTCFVAEVPLLYESGHSHFYDGVVVIVAEQEARRSRFLARDRRTSSEFSQLERKQLDMETKKRRADYIIYNDQTLDELRIAVRNCIAYFTQS